MDDITPVNILEIYKKVGTLDKRDSNGDSFLDLAVKFNDVDSLAILLGNEYDPSIILVTTIIIAAKRRNNLPILKLLCNCIEPNNFLQDIAMTTAVQECNIEFAQLILPYFKDINKITSVADNDSLIQNCLDSTRKIEEIVNMLKYLIQHGAKYNIFRDFIYHYRNIDHIEIRRLLFFNHSMKLTDDEVIETKDGKFKLNAV